MISGTPTAGGPFNFTASVIDNDGNTGSQAYALNIIVPITVNPATLPNGTTGTPYNQTVTRAAAPRPTPSRWRRARCRPVCRSRSSGAITGTPTAAGPYNFTIQATDASATPATAPTP